MKVLLLVVVVLTLTDSYVQSAAVVRSGSFPHNLYECDPTKQRVRVMQKIIQKPGRASTIISESLQYPRAPEIYPSTGIITCITVEDLGRNGKGGYAEITSGGVYYNFVTISFESQRGEDIQFAVTIYASYSNSPGGPLLTGGSIGHATIEP